MITETSTLEECLDYLAMAFFASKTAENRNRWGYMANSSVTGASIRSNWGPLVGALKARGHTNPWGGANERMDKHAQRAAQLWVLGWPVEAILDDLDRGPAGPKEGQPRESEFRPRAWAER